MLSEKDVIGVWRLVTHFYLDDDGLVSEGPLGERADGLLIYHENGYMTASMMRTSESPAPAAYLGSVDDFLGYAGRWSLRDDLVVHEVSIGSNRRVVDTEQVREVELNHDGRLRLRRRLDGPHRYVVMDWRRA
jgi:hypothetical protein